MTKSEEISLDTKSSLLSTAEKLFTKKGYSSVSTREIAEDAGVNLAAIQYHFGSKSKLFMETVNQMMQSSPCANSLSEINFTAENREEAVKKLGIVIRIFLNYFLKPSEKNACRLVIREILSETTEDPELTETLVTTFTEKFSKPLEDSLCLLLCKINKDFSEMQTREHARSILGQCVFYASHHPFLKKIDRKDFSKSPHLENTTEHVIRFSLRALGCEEKLINKTITETFKNDL